MNSNHQSNIMGGSSERTKEKNRNLEGQKSRNSLLLFSYLKHTNGGQISLDRSQIYNQTLFYHINHI